MTLKRTGHAEIDQQHSILDELVNDLGNLCNAQVVPGQSCENCDSETRSRCFVRLEKICSDLRAFIQGHNTYEEKLMDLLPDTPKCQRHIADHKHAHRTISRQLNQLSSQLNKDHPKSDSLRIGRVIDSWKGGHIQYFDAGLANYLDENKLPEIDFDDELVAILDEYVFQNRPTKINPSSNEKREKQRKTLETRGRYNALSPAQRKVFWLVVSGKTSSDIINELGISMNTVKSHRKAIFRKMEVKTMLELIKVADLL